MKKRISMIVFLLVGLLTIFSFQGVMAAEYPMEVADDLGNKVVLEEKPERIISMAPSMTELLYSLGLGDRIVGVTTFADYPEEAKNKEKIGSVSDPNVEKIISLKPDLVLTTSITKKEYYDRLNELDINIAGFQPTNIEETIAVMNKVGKLVGEEYLAKETTKKMTKQLNEIEDLVSEKLENNERPGVFYEIWHDPLMTAGDNTFIDDLIETAGGSNIGAQAQGLWPQFNLEKLIAENPDVYISSHHSDAHTFTVEGLKARDNYDVLNAVKNDRVYFVEQNLITRPSPRIIIGLKELTESIWPDLKDELAGI